MVAQSRSRPTSETHGSCGIVLMEQRHRQFGVAIILPVEIKLSKLHAIFQAAMGWEDCHLHIFDIDGERYGIPDPDWEDDDIDEDSVVFSDVVSGRSRFFYEYDFGDSWRHEVVVEAVDPVPVIVKFAVCIDGRGACPPEDCGEPAAIATYSIPLATPATTSIPATWIGRLAPLTPKLLTYRSSMPLCSGCANSGVSAGHLQEALTRTFLGKAPFGSRQPRGGRRPSEIEHMFD